MLGGRYALLVATSQFDNSGLQQLRSPARDVEELASVLQDTQIGNFEVATILNQAQSQVMRSIETFFSGRDRGDLLLLHISSHGLKADHGELYFAARDTDRELLASSAIPAAFLQSQMNRCRAKTIVLLLDCCYSGAFLPGTKGDSTVHIKDELSGHGRVVLTATSRTEYAWEGNDLSELEPEPSYFTGAVIEGLRSGDADRDRDGKVTVHELYDYVYDQVRAKTTMQSPQIWAELEYQVVVARSPFATEPATEATLPGMESAVTLSPAPELNSLEQMPTEAIDPTRRDNAVAQLKRALPDPVRRIEVFDLVDRAVAEVVGYCTLDRRPVSGQVFADNIRVFVDNIRGYRADSDTLLHLLATGVFHDDGSHDALWLRAVTRLSRLRDKNIQSFQDDLERLRLYPALLATWAMGIAAILGQHEQLMARLLTRPTWQPPFDSNRHRQTPAIYLNPVLVIYGNAIHEVCRADNGSKYIYPQSHFIRQELRDIFRLMEPDDIAYAEACNRFEFLASMISMDSEPEFYANPWPGEFLLDSNWGYEEIGLASQIAQEISPSWPLVTGGAFGGDPVRAEKAFKALAEYRAKQPRW
ncbi:caspase family protein [Streptomyces sp. NBC_01537]|uniref:caspase family protein n=1 Tax=Streptomyces sp. NBC_01537 TaxID=2903896 RepID=UPI0038643323